MKFMKKSAALFFCLALAFSVMAVTAWADDEAVLLDGIAEPVPNAAFTVTLEKLDLDDVTDNESNVNANYNGIPPAQTDDILDRDYGNGKTGTSGYEITKDNDVTFAIKLAYSGSAFTTTGDNISKIDGFQFTYDPDENNGVTISGLKIGGQDILNLRGNPTGNYENVYAFGSLGVATGDISMPGSTAAIIGTITFSFDAAPQNNTALTPTIKTMLVQVRGEQHPQWIVKAASGGGTPAEGGSSEYPYGATAYVTTGNPGAGFTAPSDTGATGYEDGTAATYPIYVNPYYTATVERFHANATTGVAELVTSTNKIGNEEVTVDVRYYFVANDSNNTGTYNVLDNEKRIPGYTFQGWMVKTNSVNSDTWAAYDATATGAWDEETSYPAVSSLPTGASGWTAWAADTWVTGIYDFASRTASLSNYPDASHASGVNFIRVDTTNNATAIPSGYVGNITLTPVYTRDVYTVTFKADTDANINAGSNARFGATITTNPANRERTDYYTIEDLVDTTKNPVAAADYLDIAYGSSAPYVHQDDNASLKKPGYKFVGWTLPASQDDVVAADKTAYEWATDATTRVNQVSVVRSAQMKRYGSLTLTAEWEPDIYFANVDYHYAGNGNTLVLVAVPNANREPNYTYKCNTFDMFEIPTASQRNEYLKAAIQATEDNDNTPTANGGYTISDLLFGFADAENNKLAGEYNAAYHLFAYIAASDTTEDDITLDETTNSTGNDSIVYDGDVDGSGFVSVADFGNVDTLLNGYASMGSIFAISARTGVEARLKADYTTATNTGDPATLNAFASIADVKGIYNVLAGA